MGNVSTQSNPTQMILDQLDSATATLPVSQLVNELQIVVERMSFIDVHTQVDQASPEYIAEIDALLGDDISGDLMEFIYWLASFNALGVLSNKIGRLFLSYCIKRYSSIVEIKFMVPIKLPIEDRELIKSRLGRLYDSSARVVFEEAPDIIAGFVLYDGSKTIDRSLRSHIVNTVQPRIINDVISRHGAVNA